MSEFTNKRQYKIEKFTQLAMSIVRNDNVLAEFNKIKELIDNQLEPIDVVELVDYLVRQNIPIAELKIVINKLLNLLYNSIIRYKSEPIKEKTFLWYLMHNNLVAEKKIQQLKPYIKQINKHSNTREIIGALKQKFKDLEKFTKVYTIKENILFPQIEKKLEKYRCIQIMWSFHDDIRRNIKSIINILDEKRFDLKTFNRLSAEIFFNLKAISFRDNKILFPVIDRIIEDNIFDKMLEESIEIGFPYLQPQKHKKIQQEKFDAEQIINLPTGSLSLEQLNLILNHLPVDLTFVDENNKVRYFSQPKNRIFPRTIGVIGRDVKNCHPPESVHIVEKIVEKFRKGEKDEADFWIKMGKKFILIKYYAVRNAQGQYKGVLEVSQEIQDIMEIKGQKRLLNWDD
jgi:hypothetical protein